MKLMVIPNSINGIKDSLDYVDAFLIGIKDLSVNMNFTVSIDELGSILDIIGNKELFISINKNLSNDDIEIVKDIMIKLNEYKVKGLFYYDVGILNIYNSIEVSYDLVWASEHAATNCDTINYWNSFGVKYCMVSSDITIKDVYEIRNKTSCKLIVPIFGYVSMFNSKRHIVKNYLDYFNLNDSSKINYMEKEGEVYPIIDNKLGTTVYTNYILNGIIEYNNLKNNGIDYLLFNGFNIDSNKFIDVLKKVKDINSDNVLECYEYINSLFDNTSTGFLYQDTIVKVKKDEK